MVLSMTDRPRMDNDRNHTAARILKLTLEIISLITGEDYTVVKKSSGEFVTPRVSGEWSKTQSDITEPPPHSLIHEQKILELTNRITELLTGEVPVRCEDVTVYFSMEEWEYLESHKDLYEDVMKKNQQSLTSPGGHKKPSSNKSLIGNPENGQRLGKHFDKKSDISCSECGKCFTRKSNLVKHLRIHTEEKPLPCPECGDCFSKTSLVEHLASHTGETSISCSECGKCFTYTSEFIEHLRTHTKEKPYSCLECGKCFNTKSHFVAHLRIHTGEKPFPCSECGKSFIEKSSLVKHQRTHTGEKPFLCPECGKCFSQKSHLVTHLRSHTGETPFLCSECGKCFSHKSSLTEHLRSHTGEAPYSCAECGKRFCHKSSLYSHQKTYTGRNHFNDQIVERDRSGAAFLKMSCDV